MRTTKDEFKNENPAVYALAQTIIAQLENPQGPFKEEKFWSLLILYYDKAIKERP